jgi:hypothetical protein
MTPEEQRGKNADHAMVRYYFISNPPTGHRKQYMHTSLDKEKPAERRFEGLRHLVHITTQEPKARVATHEPGIAGKNRDSISRLDRRDNVSHLQIPGRVVPAIAQRSHESAPCRHRSGVDKGGTWLDE